MHRSDMKPEQPPIRLWQCQIHYRTDFIAYQEFSIVLSLLGNLFTEELSKLLHASWPCPARLERRPQQLHNTQSIISVASDGFHLGNPCPIHTKHSFESSSTPDY